MADSAPPAAAAAAVASMSDTHPPIVHTLDALYADTKKAQERSLTHNISVAGAQRGRLRAAETNILTVALVSLALSRLPPGTTRCWNLSRRCTAPLPSSWPARLGG